MKLKKTLEEKSKLFVTICLTILVGLLLISIIQNTRETQPSLISADDNSIVVLNHKQSNTKITLEVASTNQKRKTGLMFRESLAENTGMLFIFPAETELSFWMKDTSISLDMIFLNSELQVTTIHNNTKPNQITEFYDSSKPSQYVVEVPAGWANQNSLANGDLFEVVSIK